MLAAPLKGFAVTDNRLSFILCNMGHIPCLWAQLYPSCPPQRLGWYLQWWADVQSPSALPLPLWGSGHAPTSINLPEMAMDHCLPVSLSSARPAEGWQKHRYHGISRMLWGGSPSRILPFTFCPSLHHSAVQSHNSPDVTIPVIFHAVTAIFTDLCKSRIITPLKSVDLLWDKRGIAKGQLLPMEDEMLPIY